MVMHVGIVGAGFLGAGVALELALRGARVTLIERLPEALRGAAIANEGKLHFGYVYARDDSMASARLMLRGALAMAPTLRRWLGDAAVERMPRGPAYRYAVHRDSLSGPDDVAAHYARCTALAHEMLGGRNPDCFGADPRRAPRRIAPDAGCNPDLVQALFHTDEPGIDNRAVADLLRARIAAEPRITLLAGTRVLRAEAAPDAVTLHLDHGETQRFDHVVNASWESRLALDAGVGIAPPPDWLFRLKYLVRMRTTAPPPMPPTTVCVGAFGDVVVLDDGQVVLSWYPAGRMAMSRDVAPPDWPRVLHGDDAARMRTAMIDGLGGVFPPLLALHDDPAPAEVSAGVIYARGQTDVHLADSGLHARAAIGRYSQARWHSVDPGKWTTCPLFAMDTADHILPRARAAA